MIELKDFLLTNIKGQGEYALVSYNGVTESTYGLLNINQE